MKLLHTSDWHLGRSLYGRKRYDEFESFLSWLLNQIREEAIDTVLVAGDVFDTGTPSNRAQQLYYRFLREVADSSCQNMIIVAGNHDSPTFLNAPKELLKALNVTVIGSISNAPQDEIIALTKQSEASGSISEAAVLCAVPYLRDRDIRSVEPGESTEDKHIKLVGGLKAHYQIVAEKAVAQRNQLHIQTNIPVEKIPIICTGHLFTAGGKTVDGDGVRELYVGSLAHVTENVFPDCIDYLALGHLHVPQSVSNIDHMRYAGSPIPMGFGEATQQKQVLVIEFDGRTPLVKPLQVPCFQPLVSITGDLEEIETSIAELTTQNSTAWVEIEYTGKEAIGSLRERIEQLLSGTNMEVRRIKNRRIMERVIERAHHTETLEDLSEFDVFERCLSANEEPAENRDDLRQAYREIITNLHENDRNAE
jgi:exonuclease SbcD